MAQKEKYRNGKQMNGNDRRGMKGKKLFLVVYILFILLKQFSTLIKGLIIYISLCATSMDLTF